MRTLACTIIALSVGSACFGAEPPPLSVADIGELALESGEILRDAKVGYRTSGTLNGDKSNAVLFPTWFTGSSEDLYRSGSLDSIDTSRFFLIAVDALANGVSSSPSNHPGFSSVTIGDMVNAQHRLVTEVLGLDRLYAVMGISMGGMQTFEWITAYPELVERAMPIVGSPRLASYDVLLWEAQLEAIRLARESGDPERAGALTNMISALALRTPGYHARLTPRRLSDGFLMDAKRGAAQTMVDREAQLRAMIDHDVSRRFGGSMEKAASAVRARVVNVVGLEDHMVTPEPAIRFTALVGAESVELSNDCGHLAMGCDVERMDGVIRAFLER